MIEIVKKYLEKYLPLVLHLNYYYKGYRRQAKSWVRIDGLFNKLIENFLSKKCLQIGARNNKYSKAFVCVDLYDGNDYVDYHYDIHSLKFDDEVFDLIVCNAILEHVVSPPEAIKELYRVLKKGGEIWVEVPFNQPYHPCPHDYWRVTVDGIEEWMKSFEKIQSGVFGNIIYNGVFFHGKKK